MELSPEEERHIQNLSVIPAAIVIYIFIGYLVYLIRLEQSFRLSFYVPYLLVVFALIMHATFFLSVAILTAHKAHVPLASQTKRFLGRMSISCPRSIHIWSYLGHN